MSVLHNGVWIHHCFEIPGPTPGGGSDEPGKGPIRLQDHGCPVRFRNIWVRRREFLQMLAAAPAGLAAAPRASRPARENNMAKPNILLLMTDQHRADCLGCYDNPVIKTPNFDRIAKEGVVFERAYTSTPSCTPARAGLLTGLSPWRCRGQ